MFKELGVLGCALLLSSCIIVDDEPVAAPPPSPSAAASPTEVEPLCDEDIPFQPTYLPKDFDAIAFPAPFESGRPPDSAGQVIVHYRSRDSRAIEVRRPGTLFTELAQSDDAPRIEVLDGETNGFGPIEPGGDDFIVQFTFPSSTRTPRPCDLYSLNEYGVGLEQLKRVAEGLVPKGR